ncbi:MAG: hypothetical protein JWN90_43 [Parcubacteria group bacterium]|nr:hypothetical protein [Parcubacteria group bacterium]
MAETLPTPEDFYKNVGSWHGTGRYKYENGEVVDILKGILHEGALSPYSDTSDQKRPNAQSISFARSRTYARLYASLFFPGNERSLRELWNRLFWCCRYLLPSVWVAWKERVPLPFTAGYKSKVASFIAKFSHKKQSLLYLLLWSGTDISFNYPMVIGVEREAYAITYGSQFVDLHEDRAVEPISIKKFTHIEVPRDQVSEVQQLLRTEGYQLPVISIEEGDKN